MSPSRCLAPIIASIALLAPGMVLAAPDKADLSRHYMAMLDTGWPQHWMRDSEQQWLAERAVDALQQCMQAGAEPSYCRQLVLDSLVEMMGTEPVSSLSYTRLEMHPAD